jgi:hypothetical protein
MYNTDATVRLQIRELMALAFVPLAIVRQSFHLLQLAADQRLTPLFAYFRQQWLLSISPRMWNVHNVHHRTNNDLEGWHFRFQNLVSKHHPNIWNLITCLKKEQSSTEVMIHQVTAGQRVHVRPGKYRRIEKNLKKIKNRYRRGQLTACQYITAVSYNLASYH